MTTTGTIDMALEIIRQTNDGDDLSPGDLALVESAVNGFLSESGEIAFQELHKKVLEGYSPPWFHGIEHMTIDHAGYVYWKGVQVEHYGPGNPYSAKMKQATEEIARRCRILEERGRQPTVGTAVWNWDENE
ncbi:hypothetical protein ES703_119542 [subsurface metagenome]